MAGERKQKIFPSMTMGLDDETGIVEAYVSVMGIMDHDMPPDIIEYGAFGKSLEERGPNGSSKIRVLWQHQWTEVIGMPLVIQEHSRDLLPEAVRMRYPNASGGLFTRTQLVMDVQRGREAYALYKAGAMSEWSIGFDAVLAELDKVEGATVRRIKEIRLWEYSPVTWGANPATVTTDVKMADIQAEEELRRLVTGLGIDPAMMGISELVEAIEKHLEVRAGPVTPPTLEQAAQLRIRILELNHRLQSKFNV